MTQTDDKHVKNVKQIFSTITSYYDFLNHFSSAGQDILWRRAAARQMPDNSEHILDVATGTGDLAITLAKKFPNAQITGLDFVNEMMNVGREKIKNKALANQIIFIQGDALAMPFADNTFDGASIAFGLRNIRQRQAALEEMKRVVRPGGVVAVLEMTLPQRTPFRQFFHWYLNNMIPLWGKFFSGDPAAYQYLSDSIHHFLKPDELTELFEASGFFQVQAKALSFGICYLHTGKVPDER